MKAIGKTEAGEAGESVAGGEEGQEGQTGNIISCFVSSSPFTFEIVQKSAKPPNLSPPNFNFKNELAAKFPPFPPNSPHFPPPPIWPEFDVVLTGGG